MGVVESCLESRVYQRESLQDGRRCQLSPKSRRSCKYMEERLEYRGESATAYRYPSPCFPQIRGGFPLTDGPCTAPISWFKSGLRSTRRTHSPHYISPRLTVDMLSLIHVRPRGPSPTGNPIMDDCGNVASIVWWINGCQATLRSHVP